MQNDFLKADTKNDMINGSGWYRPINNAWIGPNPDPADWLETSQIKALPSPHQTFLHPSATTGNLLDLPLMSEKDPLGLKGNHEWKSRGNLS